MDATVAMDSTQLLIFWILLGLLLAWLFTFLLLALRPDHKKSLEFEEVPRPIRSLPATPAASMRHGMAVQSTSVAASQHEMVSEHQRA